MYPLGSKSKKLATNSHRPHGGIRGYPCNPWREFRLYNILMNFFTSEINGQPVLRAMPILLGVLCILAIAYRYYSAFIA